MERIGKTKKFSNRVLALLLSFMMIVGMLPMTAFAASNLGQVRVIVENTTYSKADGAPWDGVLVDKWVDLDENSTMMSCFVDALGDYSQTGAESNYITKVNGLAAFDGGSASGWMGTLNDWFTNEGFGAFTVADGKLSAGDEIRIMYTMAYGEDLGGSWGNPDKTVKELSFSAGGLSPNFHKDTHEYTLTVPDDVDSVVVTPTASNKNYQVRTSVGDVEYKRTASVPVADGTVITVKCGDPDWPSMNSPEGEAQVYTVTVKKEASDPALTLTLEEPAVMCGVDNKITATDAEGREVICNWEVSQADLFEGTETWNGAAAVTLNATAAAEGVTITATSVDDPSLQGSLTFDVLPMSDNFKELKEAVDGVSLSDVTGLYVRETDWDADYNDVTVTNVEQTWQLRMERDDIDVSVVDSQNPNIAADGAVKFTDTKTQGNVKFRFTLGSATYEKEVLVTVPAHVKTVQEQIDGIAALFESEEGFDLIAGNNTSKDAVTQPLKLRNTASYYGLTGYSDVKLTWKSSNTDVIDPPSYGSDSVKINRPANGQPDAVVTLTLTVGKQYSSDEGKAKTVEIVLKVPAVTDEELAQAKAAVEAALENVTLDGFTESGSLGKTEINPQALDFDVQLKDLTDLISDGMIDDNDINKSMEWEWSTSGKEADGNYLKINYLKCNVMRTVGVPDTETELILSLTYNGYTGSKAFPVTIKGLTQEEVESAKAEMEEYEAAVWNGLKGENTSPDFVTYNLGWDRENGHVAFYRMHKENGEFVYTLKNGSCPANVGVEFDSWKSSDPTVIGHTTGGYGTVDILELLKRPNLGEAAYEVTLSSKMKNLRYGNAKNADGTPAVPDITAQLELTVPAFTNELETLELEGVDFEFDPTQNVFSIKVPKDVNQLTVTAKAKDPVASVTVNGQKPDEAGKVIVSLSETGTRISIETTVQEQKKTVTLNVKYEVEYQDIYNETGKYLSGTVTNPGVASTGGEWAVLGLARAGYPVEEGYFDKYVSNLMKTLKENDGVLDDKKYTEYSRVVLALTSIGYDVTDVGGYNLLKPLADFDKTVWQGINGAIFALIAFDSHDYEIPEAPEGAESQTTREKLIQRIIELELAGGGWSLFGNQADTDITAMAIQALAPYYESNANVKAAVDRALAKLSTMQDSFGSFGSVVSGSSSSTSESCAQVVVALTALGIDPDSDPRFVKNGNSVLDALLSYAVEDGGFKHVASGDINGMATEQGYYALAAYDRFLNDKTSLYDMTDVKIGSEPEQPEPEEEDRTLSDWKGSGITITGKESILTGKMELEANLLISGDKYDQVKAALKDGKFNLYDLYLLENNVPVQPKGTVTISIPVLGGYTGEKCKVYCLNEDGSLIEVEAVLKDGALVFETEYIGLYAVWQAVETESGNPGGGEGENENPVIPDDGDEDNGKEPVVPDDGGNEAIPGTGGSGNLSVWLTAAAISLIMLVIAAKKKKEQNV